MKGTYWAGVAAAVVLCAVCAALLLWAKENRGIGQTRTAVENAADAENESGHCPVDFAALQVDEAAGQVFRMSCSIPAVLWQEVCFIRFSNAVCSKIYVNLETRCNFEDIHGNIASIF